MDVEKALRRKISWSEILVILLLCGQAALYILMWLRLLDDPSLGGMDFLAFYTAGRIASAGHYSQLYDLDLQRAIQPSIIGADKFGGGVNLSQHPPYLAPLLALVMTGGFVQSYISWSLIRLVVMIGCGELICRHLLRAGWGSRPAILGALSCVCFFPFFLSLLSGQDSAFVLLGLLLFMFGLVNRHEIQAGFGLAISSLSPIIAGVLGLTLLGSRRRSGLWFLLGMVLLGGYSLALIGIRGIKDFLMLLDLSVQSQGYGSNQASMYNLFGLLLRTFHYLSPATARLAAWAALFSSIVYLVILWWNKQEHLRMEYIGIAVVLSTFTSPHLHIHGISYLILPLLSLMMLLWKRGQKSAALLCVPLLSTLMLLAGLLKPAWDYWITYLLMLTLAVSLFLNLKRNDKPNSVIHEFEGIARRL